MSIVETGGTFLGYLTKANNFFNFFPTAKFVETGLHVLSASEITDLFSGSSARGRNLWFPAQQDANYAAFLEEYLDHMLILEIAERDVSPKTNQNGAVTYRLFENNVRNSLCKFADAYRMDIETLARQKETLAEEVQSFQRMKDSLEPAARELENYINRQTSLRTELQTSVSTLTADKDSAESALKEAQEKLCEAQQALEQIEALKSGLDAEVHSLRAQRDRLKKECEDSGGRNASLQKEVMALEEKQANLIKQHAQMEAYFQEILANPLAKLGALTADDQLAGWMQQTLARRQEPPKPDILCLPYPSGNQNLAAELCSRVKEFRPDYSSLDILNIAICLTQGFLTVFFGEPGCGKTSICNIFASVLGLKSLDRQRYVPVSVERGWMSKRDFIGYFNPLTKTFDSSNRQVYDALRLLDGEEEFIPFLEDDDNLSRHAPLPFFILLDEANLSAMEYYWADFMNLCEDSLTEGRLSQFNGSLRKIRGTVNLGEEQLEVPDWLRFMATINTDHTTETLSPRLIDRAWLVSLPPADGSAGERPPEPQYEPLLVSWPELRDAFSGNGEPWPNQTRDAFMDLAALLQNKCQVPVSHRGRRAVRRYCSAAAQVFRSACSEHTLYQHPATIALDYAVSQRVLPQLQGNGTAFSQALVELEEKCAKYSLSKSASIVYNIRKRGKQSQYFQFF